MNVYPAIKAKMGCWPYYIVKMKMKEIASEVRFASEVYPDRTLDDAIQRYLDETRVKRYIVSYLNRRPDRFFSSIVVASIGGNPHFYDVRVTDDERFVMLADQDVDQSFGVLTFKGDQKYYALDGQHRLKAIKVILDKSQPESKQMPEGFPDEEVSVIMVVRPEGYTDDNYLKSYRKLFSSLNRYAKPTDVDTNIIMDEDDAFAIITRRLITEHWFFKWEGGKQRESPVVLMRGKNLRENQPYFTSLQTLYEMNETLLSSAIRVNKGWSVNQQELPMTDVKAYKQFRPDEEILDSYYEELCRYWDAILSVFPDLKRNATEMRVHSLGPEASAKNLMDHCLFWPIGQTLSIRIVRMLFDKRVADSRNSSVDQLSRALAELALVDWDLHNPPWIGMFLIRDVGADKWKMRSEDRKIVTEVLESILNWQIGLTALDDAGVAKLRARWESYVQLPEDMTSQSVWESMEAKTQEIAKAIS